MQKPPFTRETSELIAARGALEIALLSAILLNNRSRAGRARLEVIADRYRACVFRGEILPVPDPLPDGFVSRCSAALFSAVSRGT